MSPRNKRRVRNILLDRSTQFSLGLILAGVAVFNAVFFGLVSWFLIDELIGRVVGLDSAAAHAEEVLRAGQFDTLLWSVLLSGIYGVALFGLGVVLGHRVTGPLARVLEEVGRLSAGETPARIHLRDTDLLHPYAEEINFHLEQISMGRAHATVKLRGMVERLDGAEPPSPQQTGDELREVIALLHPPASLGDSAGDVPHDAVEGVDETDD